MNQNYLCLRLLFAGLIAMSPVQAGIPESQTDKYQRLRGELYIDTELVQVNGQAINFWLKVGSEESSRFLTRIKCKDFTSRTDVGGDTGGYKTITRSSFQYELANQLCFLTGTSGYSPEPDTPAWARKIILLRESR